MISSANSVGPLGEPAGHVVQGRRAGVRGQGRGLRGHPRAAAATARSTWSGVAELVRPTDAAVVRVGDGQLVVAGGGTAGDVEGSRLHEISLDPRWVVAVEPHRFPFTETVVAVLVCREFGGEDGRRAAVPAAVPVPSRAGGRADAPNRGERYRTGGPTIAGQ